MAGLSRLIARADTVPTRYLLSRPLASSTSMPAVQGDDSEEVREDPALALV